MITHPLKDHLINTLGVFGILGDIEHVQMSFDIHRIGIKPYLDIPFVLITLTVNRNELVLIYHKKQLITASIIKPECLLAGYVNLGKEAITNEMMVASETLYQLLREHNPMFLELTSNGAT